MWVISKYGFASAVEHTDKPGCVLVRARDRTDLEEFCAVARDCDVPGFSEEAIEENPSADYRFRMTVKDEDWAELVKALAVGINYPNFKNEVAKVDPGRADIYTGVWSELMKIQYPESGDLVSRAEADRRDRVVGLYGRAAAHLAACLREYEGSLPEESLGDALDPPVLAEQAEEDPADILEERLIQRVAIGFFQQASGEGFERLKNAEQDASKAAALELTDSDWVPED
jgi:hypothetical protein